MLVIISDLHLSDGSTGVPIPASAFSLFLERLRAMAFDASKLSDPDRPGKTIYKPIESFDLVLLGDIFDLIRSTEWTKEKKGEQGYTRPWSNPKDKSFTQKIDRITDKILECNAESCKVIRNLASGETIKIPASMNEKTRNSRKVTYSRKRVSVKANIYYLVGNHDWFYHLKQPDLDPVRQKVITSLGLKNKKEQFPYEPVELPDLKDTLVEHGVYARHGDHNDPFNFDENYGIIVLLVISWLSNC